MTIIIIQSCKDHVSKCKCADNRDKLKCGRVKKNDFNTYKDNDTYQLI